MRISSKSMKVLWLSCLFFKHLKYKNKIFFAIIFIIFRKFINKTSFVYPNRKCKSLLFNIEQHNYLRHEFRKEFYKSVFAAPNFVSQNPRHRGYKKDRDYMRIIHIIASLIWTRPHNDVRSEPNMCNINAYIVLRPSSGV